MAIWIDGSLRDGSAATVSALDHGFTVGDGVFETLKVVDGVPFALTRHLRRLSVSAGGLGLPDPDHGVVRDAVRRVLVADGPPAGRRRLRITYTGGVAPLGSERGQAPPTLVVVSAPLGEWPATAAVAVVPWTRNERSATAGLKTTSYAENVVALAYARRAGASEGIFANTVGQLCEGTGSNVVLEVDGRLVTPTLGSGALAGVTRALALEWCGVEEQDVPLEALTAASEVLLTSTTRDLQVVERVDGHVLPGGAPGPLAAAAQEVFAARMAQDADP